MDAIHICGGNTLCGEVDVQGSKNGALPVLAATLLVKGRTVIENCPRISDIDHMLKLLAHVGCKVTQQNGRICIDAGDISETVFPGEHAQVMRSSLMLLGAMLGRAGEITIEYPGGCVIGKRPIDLHKKALEQMGVVFSDEQDKIRASAVRLVGETIRLSFPSVGATENVILAAVLAEGTTVLYGCAREPEIVELCSFLNHAGAKIFGMGTERIIIQGVERLEETGYSIMPDRIVAGTYLLAGIMTGGMVALNHAPVSQMQGFLQVLEKMGADIASSKDWICVGSEHSYRSVPNLKTGVYPGFPTDLQSAFMAALCLAEGCSLIEETIFENRFRIVSQLTHMGADIHVMGHRAMVCGVRQLHGEVVTAEELRGGAALVLAGLAAGKETMVLGCEYIERGYEDICRDLRALGGNVQKVPFEKGKQN